MQLNTTCNVVSLSKRAILFPLIFISVTYIICYLMVFYTSLLKIILVGVDDDQLKSIYETRELSFRKWDPYAL